LEIAPRHPALAKKFIALAPVGTNINSECFSMQRIDISKPLVLSAKSESPPPAQFPLENARPVPDSFADWLARPAQTITAGPEPNEGVFVNLSEGSKIDVVCDQPKPRQ
jgi:hypothetical protein